MPASSLSESEPKPNEARPLRVIRSCAPFWPRLRMVPKAWALGVRACGVSRIEAATAAKAIERLRMTIPP
ncbi:hypothetical protein D3C72_2425620 [compost metagenome]